MIRQRSFRLLFETIWRIITFLITETRMKNGLIINGHGTKRWYLNDKLHCEDGTAAVIFPKGREEWHLNGIIQRKEFPTGKKEWYLNGKLHSKVLPSGRKEWYLNGDYHRVDGPAVECANGDKLWFLNGLPHREDGPAEEWASGSKIWHLNGLTHRVDGPAWEFSNGDTYWWLNGATWRQPEGFPTMEKWFEYLNENEEETYQLINDINGFIVNIKNPSDRQKRLHQMKHLL